MIEKILQLEKTARQLEPSAEDRHLMFDKAQQYTEEFLNSLYPVHTYVADGSGDNSDFNLRINETSSGIEELLSFLKKNVDNPGINPASGGHLGYIPGGGIYPSSIGDYIAAVTNRYAGIFYASPGAVRMENSLLAWMAGIAGYPETSGGNLTSGGSISNLIAIVTAREACGVSVKNIEKSVIYLSSQTHHSFEKALRIAGLKECVKHYIPVDSKFRMVPEALEDAVRRDVHAGLKPWMVVASAGTTDTGAVDPLDNIAEVALNYKLWYHIDAAYGGFFILCEEGKNLLKGIEKSDSFIIDPHKGLFLPYGSGAVLVRDKSKLYDAHYYQAGYMQDALAVNEELSPAELSPELSKHFRGLRLWFALKIIGLSPFRAALEEKILLARYAYEKLSRFSNIELGPYPDLSVFIFRFKPSKGSADEFNRKLLEEIHKDGRIFISSTMINGKFMLRIAVMSFRTHLEEINLMLDIILEKLEVLEN